MFNDKYTEKTNEEQISQIKGSIIAKNQNISQYLADKTTEKQ